MSFPSLSTKELLDLLKKTHGCEICAKGGKGSHITVRRKISEGQWRRAEVPQGRGAVKRGIIGNIRRKLHLDEKHGVSTDAFYYGTDQ